MLDILPLILYLFNMIQNIVFKTLTKNATARKVVKMKKASPPAVVLPRPKLQAPKHSPAMVAFLQSL